VEALLSSEYFSVDRTLIEAWASHKSLRPKDGSGDDHTMAQTSTANGARTIPMPA
jgi:hypothetical protein